MHVFVTGATGWIGTAVVGELLGAGHEVTGLARSDAAALKLAKAGARIRRGDLDDLDGLRDGALDAQAVIHLGNKHDWANPAENNRTERAAIETLAGAPARTHRPLVLAGALAGGAPGRPAAGPAGPPAVGPDSMRGGGETLAFEYVDRGVRVAAARFAPSVHGVGAPGFLAPPTGAARRHGVSAYVGDGDAAWSAVHRPAAARLV